MWLGMMHPSADANIHKQVLMISLPTLPFKLTVALIQNLKKGA